MTGLLGKKRGMSAVYDPNGRHTPVSVIELGPCTVMEVKTRETHNYDATKLAFEPVRRKVVTKPVQGQFDKIGSEPHRYIREFKGMTGDFEPGSVLKLDIFKPGDKVEVIGISKGRGFTGVIKRHNFSRPNQSHGTHEIFRGGGSIGSHSYPARVWPGQKMPGRMGGDRVKVKNLMVMGVDEERGLILIKGAVPGAPGGLVAVQKVR